MNKKLTLIFCLLAMILPIMGFAQTDSDYSNLLQFLKGDGAFEKWFMEIFTKLDNSVQDSAQGSALVGKAIGCMKIPYSIPLILKFYWHWSPCSNKYP